MSTDRIIVIRIPEGVVTLPLWYTWRFYHYTGTEGMLWAVRDVADGEHRCPIMRCNAHVADFAMSKITNAIARGEPRVDMRTLEDDDSMQKKAMALFAEPALARAAAAGWCAATGNTEEAKAWARESARALCELLGVGKA